MQSLQTLSSASVFIAILFQLKDAYKIDTKICNVMSCSYWINSYCVVPENIHTPSTEGFFVLHPHTPQEIPV